MNSGTSPLVGLLPLVIAALVVLRFAFRELRERTVRTPALWVRPGILIALLVYLVVLTFAVDSRDDDIAFVALLSGIIVGALTGWGIVRNTTFRSAGIPKAIRVQGNRATLAIWVGALALRFVARYVVPGGMSARGQLPLNCGTVALIAVAFVVIAVAFQREIRRLAPAG